jgi:hypothetical protein
MEHKYKHAIPLFITIIQDKAKSLFDKPNAVYPNPKVPMFAASAGWFEYLKGCHGFHNLKLTGNAAGNDSGVAEKFPALPPSDS